MLSCLSWGFSPLRFGVGAALWLISPPFLGAHAGVPMSRPRLGRGSSDCKANLMWGIRNMEVPVALGGLPTGGGFFRLSIFCDRVGPLRKGRHRSGRPWSGRQARAALDEASSQLLGGPSVVIPGLPTVAYPPPQGQAVRSIPPRENNDAEETSFLLLERRPKRGVHECRSTAV